MYMTFRLGFAKESVILVLMVRGRAVYFVILLRRYVLLLRCSMTHDLFPSTPLLKRCELPLRLYKELLSLTCFY